MSTSAIVRFAKRETGVSFNEQPRDIQVQIYQHFNGTPEQLGMKLAGMLVNKKVVNGFSRNLGDIENQINGPGDLAATVLAQLKYDVDGELEKGNVYLEPPSNDRGGINYTYYIWSDYNKEIYISIFGSSGGCEFVGTPEDLQSSWIYNMNT